MHPAFLAATYLARGARRASSRRAASCQARLSGFPAADAFDERHPPGPGQYIIVQEYEENYGSDWNCQATTPGALAGW
jgi:hypothetical protein